ncbi:MAG: hypothetical protein AVDCRST_MAG77-2306 [uncultured Chloroflexi bacterium]|uniref:Uncharacterized protein n=1 Tax=uncultured Chloroflexota bacterium TaxID=166587 RepID=A0A6J4INW4_9CHLR|nr:MAG: hypothetical protein AVDCRST_MAG77-2306 [uncultured Chloroflexota bacterium]
MDDKNLNTVQQYVGDMLALESHIEEALGGQLKEVRDDARFCCGRVGTYSQLRQS